MHGNLSRFLGRLQCNFIAALPPMLVRFGAEIAKLHDQVVGQDQRQRTAACTHDYF
jgi:hypothetical protein